MASVASVCFVRAQGENACVRCVRGRSWHDGWRHLILVTAAFDPLARKRYQDYLVKMLVVNVEVVAVWPSAFPRMQPLTTDPHTSPYLPSLLPSSPPPLLPLFPLAMMEDAQGNAPPPEKQRGGK